MAKSTLTPEDIAHLDTLLHDRDDRTAFYVHYYELTGNRQVLEMANISKFTEFSGAVAERANEVIQERYPDLYPEGGVVQASHGVAEHLFDAITKDFYEGSHTGVLDERAALEAAKGWWADNGMSDQFPGNPLVAGERLADLDVKGAWDAFASEGTGVALEAAAYAALPDISGNPPHPELQEQLDHATYHTDATGTVGVYVDPDTGRTIGVFDRPADLSTEPPIESQGILNMFPVDDTSAVAASQALADLHEQAVSFQQQPAHEFVFGTPANDAWAGANESPLGEFAPATPLSTFDAPAGPVAESPFASFSAGLQDFFGGTADPAVPAASPSWDAPIESTHANDAPGLFESIGSLFPSPPTVEMPDTYDHSSAFDPPDHGAGSAFGFGDAGSHDASPAYESAPSYDFGHTSYDSGYSSPHDSGSYDSGSHDSGHSDSGSHDGGSSDSGGSTGD